MKRKRQNERVTVGVIGGSGLYDIEGLTSTRSIRVRTPFGAPSDAITVGWLEGIRVAFLSRHGRGHLLNPSGINYRANIFALKSLGVSHVISVSAVGSMKESIHPGDVVVPDQFIDLTKRRVSTFFDEGLVAHVAFSDPVCEKMAACLAGAARTVGARVHERGTYVCIEGPQFSTRAESLLYRSWAVSVVGMTAMPEAKLAREAELPYACLALATDYDCWHTAGEPVTVEAVVAVMNKNVATARRVIAEVARTLPDAATSRAHGALTGATMTAPHAVSEEAKKKLDWLLK